MIKTRIRFSALNNGFYVQEQYLLLWLIPTWHRAKRKRQYSGDDDEVRYFDTYNQAREFSIKMATDVLVKHKRNEYEPMV